jgi:pyruvate/2-oxoglutarate/acetoin dehydrogenase E1 component
LESLNNALHRAFADSELVYLLGEDVLDPYGGAFKVTKGLSTAYPDRVLTTPISEAGFVGVAAGMALRGLRPVVEIMFGDFITLMADQLVNHISKFRWMYNDQVTVPLVIRTPMGGRRGYGPTHSQTLEKLYLGLPGLQVIAPAPFCQADGSGSPDYILYHCILQGTDPTLFLENKLGYVLPVQGQPDLKDLELTSLPTLREPVFPVYRLSLRAAPSPTLTIAAYGYMAELARQALERLAFERELFAELIIPTRLAPFEVSPIIESASRTRALLVIEEGTYTLGWGAEVVARVAEASTGQMLTVRRLAAQDLPIPVSTRLEQAILPGVEHIIQSAIEMVA